MSANPHDKLSGQMRRNEDGRIVIVTDRPERKRPEHDKNLEIENLKRLLASISQRLDALKTI